MKILIINSGSSSIKYQFFNNRHLECVCKGIVERIGSQDSVLTHYLNGKNVIEKRVDALDHHKAIEYIFGMLTSVEAGVIKSHDEIKGIGHRVVHGGEFFTKPTLIDEKVISVIKSLNELAPLHNPPALLGIRACCKFAKDIPQVAVFDTAFHQTIPPHAYIYAIPYEFYKNYKIRRYGFHGTSHKFVAQQAAVKLKKNLNKIKIITCHLGNGCSMAAVKNGKSIDTSMGLTPLEGLVMGTRCGDIDPAVVLHIMERKTLDTNQTDDLLNKASGLLGLTGISNDMRDILKALKSGNKQAKLAVDIFIYRIKKYIGAYAACMDGLDAVVFTAGIGENVPLIKNRISKELKALFGKFKTKLLVIPTNEELMIAQETMQVLYRNK